jgi:uncharacterized protein
MSAELQHEESPDVYRRRYEHLMAQAKSVNTRPAPAAMRGNPRDLPKHLVLREETIPGGWYWTAHTARGTTLRIVNENGTPGVSALFWNADEPTERYNPADTVKLQWTAKIGRGNILLSDMGRVMCSVTDDTCGAHDSIVGGSTPESNARNYGLGAVRNTRDNFILAASKHGLGPRDVGPCVTFFAPVVTDENGKFVWHGEALVAGHYIDLRAEMNLIVALSNCPHPLASGASGAKDVRATLWKSPPATKDDYCRVASEEAARAFENTDAEVR